MRKHNLSTFEGRDAVRTLVRACKSENTAPEVLQALGQDAPDIIEQLFDELEAAEADHHGQLGVDLRTALTDHLLKEDKERHFILAEGVKVESLGVHLLPGRVVVDFRLTAERFR